MSNSSWYFKRSFIDPKSGQIKLYYLHIEGKSHVLETNKALSEHKFENLPEDFPIEDALERIEAYKNHQSYTGYGFQYQQK